MLQRIRKENTDVYHYNSLTNDELWVLKEGLIEFICANPDYKKNMLDLARKMKIELMEMLDS